MPRGGPWLAAVVLAAVGAGAACGGGEAPAGPRVTLAACTVQGVPARCGSLAVLENPSAPKGRTISLRIVVLPATSTPRAADPLFYLEGGPGGAASAEVGWVRQHFEALNAHHDIVMVDQRGTGGSNQATCPTPNLSTADDAAVAAAVQQCVDSVRDVADPAYYTTPLAVDDFDSVRAALGYDKIDLYGVSYGVSSGLTYIQRHGEHLRAAVLDSGSLLDYHIYEAVPRSAQQSMQLLFARCRRNAACAARFGDPAADFAAVTARLGRGPVMTEDIDPASGAFVTIDLNGFLNLVISGYLADTSAAARLPRDLHAAARGDWSALATTLISMGGGGMSVMAVTVRCSDEWSTFDPAATAASAPGSPFVPFQVAFATGMSAICKHWPHQPGAAGRVTSSAPVVFLNSTGDPADPPENVAGVQADMPNSLVVRVGGTGHWQLDADSSGCLDAEVATFIESGRPSTLAAWPCATAPALPAFVTA